MSKKPQYKRYTRNRFGNVFYFVFLALAGLFTLLPMIYCVVTSLKPLDELLIFPPRFWVNRPTMDNFTAIPGLLSNLKVPMSRYIFNSVFLSVFTTAAQVLVASMASYGISRLHLRGMKTFFMLVQFSLLYNATTLGIPQYLIFAKTGMINTYLVYILPYLQSSMGVFLLKQYMDDSIPEALMEAARIDGAGVGRIYWNIVMPNIKPGLLTLVLFSFKDTWNFTSGATIFDDELKTLPEIVSQISGGGLARAGSAMAVTVLMMIPSVVVYMVTQSNVIETMSSAGIKG